MAAQVVPLPQLKLPTGPAPFTAEQRYWKSFKNQRSHTTTASWGVTHISFPGAAAAAAAAGGSSTTAATTTSSLSSSATAATKANDLFAVTAGPRVDLYSIRKREPVKTIGRFEAVARSGEIRPDGRVLVAGDDSGKMQVFDVAGGSRPVVLRTWHTHKQPTWVTRWAPASLTTLMSASDDKTVRLWDLTSPDPARTFVGHQDYVRAGAFLPASTTTGGGGGTSSNHLLVTGAYDATVRLWDARAPGGAVLTFQHAAPVEAAPDHSPLTTLTLLTALRHRSALREALADRDEATVQPVLRWVCRHIVDPRFTAACTDVGLHLLDLYAAYAGASPELAAGFQLLWKKVRREVEQAQLACQTSGMVENLMMSAVA
ncbi:small nucleolar ribonucleoprotein complex subunit [Niveomyces insectorum RCEF 264]|uniref:Small nucleolar ribonucleoprotein complex subunit n=1 Tax=Niveomyces insectorum RCEF 264 TaxID=1081102 RepID=A0A167X7Q6_9HYPO|nr:small nucleolar ribonucleoprotein complex subunit [Niveomyces insectorum RCEF 264]